MKIAFSGSHGTGKSTKTFEYAVKLKKMYTDRDIGVFVENARKSPFKLNKETSFESQMWIFTNQIQNELLLTQNHDILVCDRPIFDALAYTKWVDEDLYKKMLELSKGFINSYHKIYFCKIENNNYWYKDAKRESEDAYYRDWIEHTLLDIYDILNIDIEII